LYRKQFKLWAGKGRVKLLWIPPLYLVLVLKQNQAVKVSHLY
jgi:hypothetical protein